MGLYYMKYFISKLATKDVIYTNLLVKFGVDDESLNELEYTHLMEHLFAFFTSKKYPHYNQVHSIFRDNGITFSAQTDDYYTKYSFSCNKKKLSVLMDVIHQTINYFQIDESIFSQEKKSVILELKTFIESPTYPINTKINSVLFPNHARSVSIERWITSIKACKPADIMRFYKKHYRKTNFIVSFCGNITPATIEKFNIGTPYVASNKPPRHIQHGPLNKIYKVKKTDAKAYITVCYKVAFGKFDTRIYACVALLKILVGGLDTLLYKKLRSDLGLVYSINDGSVIDPHKDFSFVSIETNTIDTKSNIQKVIKTITDIVYNLSIEDIDTQLNKFKIAHKLSLEKHRNCKNGAHMLNFHTSFIIHGKDPVDFFTYNENHNKLTAIEILELSKQIFTPDNMLVVYSSK